MALRPHPSSRPERKSKVEGRKDEKKKNGSRMKSRDGAERAAYFARREAAGVLRQVLRADATRRATASIKSLVYSPSVRNKKATFALVCQTLKCTLSLSLTLWPLSHTPSGISTGLKFLTSPLFGIVFLFRSDTCVATAPVCDPKKDG